VGRYACTRAPRRLPVSLPVPWLLLRHNTPQRWAHSALVGVAATPWTWWRGRRRRPDAVPAGGEGRTLLQEREALGPPVGQGLGPSLCWEAASRRPGGGIKQPPVAHEAISSGLVRLIALTPRMARQQKRVGSGILHTLPTP
jgi:hypothetical protein